MQEVSDTDDDVGRIARNMLGEIMRQAQDTNSPSHCDFLSPRSPSSGGSPSSATSHGGNGGTKLKVSHLIDGSKNRVRVSREWLELLPGSGQLQLRARQVTDPKDEFVHLRLVVSQSLGCVGGPDTVASDQTTGPSVGIGCAGATQCHIFGKTPRLLQSTSAYSASLVQSMDLSYSASPPLSGSATMNQMSMDQTCHSAAPMIFKIDHPDLGLDQQAPGAYIELKLAVKAAAHGSDGNHTNGCPDHVRFKDAYVTGRILMGPDYHFAGNSTQPEVSAKTCVYDEDGSIVEKMLVGELRMPREEAKALFEKVKNDLLG